MRILLIGGNGFIGTPLVRQLSDAGHELAILHRRATNTPAQGNIVSIAGDRNRLADCKPQIQEFSPGIVIDLILSSGAQAQQLVDELHGVAQRIVALSSMDVYRAWGVVTGAEPGPLEPLPLTEDSPLRTVRQAYSPETLRALQSTFTWVNEDYDKIAVEDAILHNGRIAGTVLRLPIIYGPGDPLHRCFPTVKRVMDRRPALLLADELAAWRAPRGFVENVAHAIALAATSEQAAGRVYNVCQEPSLPELDWQKQIVAQMQWHGKFVVLPKAQTPKHLLQPGNAAQHIVASSERIRKELNYREPVELAEAIRRTIAWEQNNPPAAIDPQQFDYAAEDAALNARR